MQRLLKAYKIMVETKNPKSFDANYKAIVCYNLACYCQMQSKLQECQVYLTKAIDFVNEKLSDVKKSAVDQYNHEMQKLTQTNTLEQNSLNGTSTSQKNADIYDRKTQKQSVMGKASQQRQAQIRDKNLQSQQQYKSRHSYMNLQTQNMKGLGATGNVKSTPRKTS